MSTSHSHDPSGEHPKRPRARRGPAAAGNSAPRNTTGGAAPRPAGAGENTALSLVPAASGPVAAGRPEPLPAREQRIEMARIVRRLEAIITNHLEGARRIGHPLSVEQVLAVIDALRAEGEGAARPVAFSDGEVMFYLMDGLYEELLGEPSNIFLSTPLPEGSIRFEPLQREFWLACLASLRQRMERLRLTAS